MGDLRRSILKNQLQTELEAAHRLERRGRNKEASVHYTRAGALYRRIAYASPPERANEMFHMASQYEKMASTVSDKSNITRVSEVSPALQREFINSLIVSEKPSTTWSDIGGLSEAKAVIKEAIILPFVKSKPEYVRAPRTILLYGPPGTGKTLLARASSNTLNATFFQARMPVLLSKYFGESTKLISALFSKAKQSQPSLIFIDELDALAMTRASDIDESTRRVLSQLLTEIEGFATSSGERVLIMAATNKPWDLDDAMVSRFQKKIYVPLPDATARRQIIKIHLEGADISGLKLESLVEKTEGFSGRDIQSLCQEAINHMVREMNPNLEELDSTALEKYSLRDRPMTEADFKEALEKTKPGATPDDIRRYEKWQAEFGG